MYEFVRRQQELQPNAFTSKTFQWMDGSLRESSWVKLYSRNIPTDPLAQSSSSLFHGSRSQSKPGVLQRSAGAIAPHRFAFRRHRQSSETARPPSGISGTFGLRRRGFTMPASSQPLETLASEVADTSVARRRGATMVELGAGETGSGPISATIMPHPGQSALGSAQAIWPDAPTAHSDSSCISPHSIPSPLVYPAQHLQSSFSPPHSPRPRTICNRARALMNRVRAKRPTPLKHASSPAPPDPAAPPVAISSVLRYANQVPSIGRSRIGPPLSSTQVPVPQSARMSPSLTPHNPPGARQPRALPRSPLANPEVLTAFAPEEHTADGMDAAHCSPATGSTPMAVPSNPHRGESSSSSSSGEEGRVCRVCSRYKSTEWMVECDSGHALCFGCVQSHVKQLLANTKVYTVVCPSGSCAASIATKQLRACLPPHRLQQLVANRRRHDNQASGLLRRSFSACVRWNSTDSGGRASQANLNDSAFDAPITTVTEPDWAVRCAGAVDVDVADADRDPMRFSTSMPVLHPGGDTSPAGNSSGQLLSELTRVGPGSMDSVVIAASAAADSAATLSPESVGSRLRRVPKGREPLSPTLDGLDISQPFEGLDIGQPELLPSELRALAVHSMYETRQTSPLHQDLSDMSEMSEMSGSPVSWQPASRVWAGRMPATTPVEQPPPPPLPAAFRASATWITPGQRYSGYTENLLLNATLFETIRRTSPDSDNECTGVDFSVLPQHPPPGQRLPIPELSTHPTDDDAGVYIPTWRRPAGSGVPSLPLWADAQYGEQSGLLSEAAELNFDLYETLHRRR
ncbi:hypothetical protein GGH19_000202 [Coemansia sp. RSA 1807]|nr:hypothetical protein GGF48_001767 [Coemansia sp. RSA 921]KAJ2183324.1 hypothetical protein GGF45_000049 [Coemansia sp. RSA 551]KAJ2271884.1 hypothetical protein EV176_003835 [Coemansia sp. RSA 451]KAJ2578804.1 hypothetical protein GGH19_000202 [Coemansia sp. RSA 1807]